MAGRPKIFNEETAVEKASGLFWKKGYEASSTEELLNAMGVQRGSFYHSFGSKKELFIHAIDLHETSGFKELKRILKESKRPIDAIKSLFRELANCPPAEHAMGCFAGNTVAEMSNIDEEIAGVAKKHLKTLEQIFYKQIKISQANGELSTKTDARLLATYLLNLWNGINITRRVYPSKQVLLPLIELQLEILR
jgi:TetR/AcrR family transcriptional repressor of nem operon